MRKPGGDWCTILTYDQREMHCRLATDMDAAQFELLGGTAPAAVRSSQPGPGHLTAAPSASRSTESLQVIAACLKLAHLMHGD